MGMCFDGDGFSGTPSEGSLKVPAFAVEGTPVVRGLAFLSLGRWPMFEVEVPCSDNVRTFEALLLVLAETEGKDDVVGPATPAFSDGCGACATRAVAGTAGDSSEELSVNKRDALPDVRNEVQRTALTTITANTAIVVTKAHFE